MIFTIFMLVMFVGVLSFMAGVYVQKRYNIMP